MIDQLFTRFCAARANGERLSCADEVLLLIALQSIHVLANHRTEGSLAAKLFHRGQAPWLFALVQNPDRDPAEVSKLFPNGELPRKVKAMLERPSDERLFLELHRG